MENTKRNYFKSLFKSTDVVLAIIVGFACACGLFYIDAHNLFSKLPHAFLTYLLPICKAGLIFTLAVIAIFLIFAVRKSTIDKTDSYLVALFTASLSGLISTLVNKSRCSSLMIYIWAVTLAVSVIIFIIRFICYSKAEPEEGAVEEPALTKAYFSLVARKFNLVIILGITAVLGIITISCCDIKSLFDSNVVLYCVSAIAIFDAFVIVHTVINGKKVKTDIVDVILFAIFVYLLFFAGFLIETRVMTYDLLWAIAGLATFLALIIRAIFVSVNVPSTLEKKGPRNYYGLLFEKYGAFGPVALGFVAAMLLTICAKSGLKKIFTNNLFFGIVIIAIIVLAAVLFVIGLLKKGLTSKKVNLVDYSLLMAVVGSIYSTILLTHLANTSRYCLVLIPLAVSVILSGVRMSLVELVNVDPIADDEIVLELKVVVDDETVRAYCNGQEVAVIDNRKEKAIADDEEKVDNATAEPVIEEDTTEKETEEVDVEEEVVEEVDEESEPIVEEKDKLFIAKRSFENKIKFTSDKTKEFYSRLKNELLAYKTKSKISKKSESFRKKGLFAKLSVSGKSLRIHLAIDPKSLDEGKYHQIDLSEKKAYKDVPFTMKIRSDLACRRALYLIGEIAKERGIKKNQKYEPVNFTEGLDVDGVAILEKVGALDKYAEVVSIQDAEGLTDDVLKFIPTISKGKVEEGKNNVANVYLDTALKYIEDTITLETLREVKQVDSSIGMIHVKTRTGINKKITVVADDFDPIVAKVIILTGGKIYKIVRK